MEPFAPYSYLRHCIQRSIQNRRKKPFVPHRQQNTFIHKCPKNIEYERNVFLLPAVTLVRRQRALYVFTIVIVNRELYTIEEKCVTKTRYDLFNGFESACFLFFLKTSSIDHAYYRKNIVNRIFQLSVQRCLSFA